MKVVCPHCDTQNQIDKERTIRCGRCSQPFSDDIYAKESFFQKIASAKTIGTSVVAIVTVGAVAGYTLENILDENRYPLRMEYQIIANCTQHSYSSRYVEQCICALEETLKEVKYNEIDEKFRNAFSLNLQNRKCIK